MTIDTFNAQFEYTSRAASGRRWFLGATALAVAGLVIALVTPARANQMLPDDPLSGTEQPAPGAGPGEPGQEPPSRTQPLSPAPAVVGASEPASGFQPPNPHPVLTGEPTQTFGPVEGPSPVNGQQVGRLDVGGVDGSDQPGGRTDG